MRSAIAQPHLRRATGIRYGCELAVGVLLVSLFLRTWFVQGLIVPVTVSGGSMAMTLAGPHRQVACQNCGFKIRYGTERPPAGDRAVCPNCGLQTSLANEIALHSGDSVVIDRTALNLRDPRRWEVIVFRCPERAYAYCVKRVVGLPGEVIEIRDGEILINGQLVQKDFSQIRACQQLVYAASFPSPANPRRWQTGVANSRWKHTEDGFHYPHSSKKHAEGIPDDWLTYHHLADQPIRDDYGYNQGESRQLNNVYDIGLSGIFTTVGRGTLKLRAFDGRDWFHVELAPAKGKLTLLRNGAFHVSLDVDLSPLAARAMLEFWLIDQQVMLALDGQTLLRFPLEKLQITRSPSAAPLALAATDLDVSVHKLSVWRDIYYTNPGPARHRWALDRPYQLEADQLFVLGDNSPISEDSRTLPTGAISVKLLVGKPLGVE